MEIWLSCGVAEEDQGYDGLNAHSMWIFELFYCSPHVLPIATISTNLLRKSPHTKDIERFESPYTKDFEWFD